MLCLDFKMQKFYVNRNRYAGLFFSQMYNLFQRCTYFLQPTILENYFKVHRNFLEKLKHNSKYQITLIAHSY